VASTYDAELIDIYGYFFESTQFDFGTAVFGLAVGRVSGNLLVGGGDNTAQSGELKLYDSSNNWTVISDFPSTTAIVQSVAFASDESVLLTSGNLGRVTFWNGTTYANDSTLVPGTGPSTLYEVLISDNSQYVAAAGNNNAFSWQRPNNTTQTWTENAPISSGL